jgi:hypothetical protein
MVIGAGIGAIWSGGLSATPASAARSTAVSSATNAGSERGDAATSSSRKGPNLGNYDWVYKHVTFKNHLSQSGDFTIFQAGEANCVGAVTQGKFDLPAGDLTKDVGAQINTNQPLQQRSKQPAVRGARRNPIRRQHDLCRVLHTTGSICLWYALPPPSRAEGYRHIHAPRRASRDR